MQSDVYSRVTDAILADLEKGVRPWLKPWNAGHAAGRITRPLRHNGVPYAGINVLMLWSEAVAKGYAAPLWMTFKQARELGAHVRKGEHGSLVVYASKVSREEQNPETGEVCLRDIPFMKGYTVFNVEQIEGLPDHYYGRAAPVLDPVQRNAQADAFFAATGAAVEHGGAMACYSITHDRTCTTSTTLLPVEPARCGMVSSSRRSEVSGLSSLKRAKTRSLSSMDVQRCEVRRHFSAAENLGWSINDSQQ